MDFWKAFVSSKSSEKLPGKVNPELITKEFFPEYVDNTWAINCGRCMAWAYIAYLLYDDVTLLSTDYHAFVQQEGKFYDSESGKGKRNWEHLNCIMMWWEEENNELFVDDVRDFKNRWAGCFTGWEECEKKVEEYLKKRKATIVNDSLLAQEM